MPLLWHVWYKDTVQVSDGFGNKRGLLIYHIKLQRKSISTPAFLPLGLEVGVGVGELLDNARVSNHKNYRVFDKDIPPRYTSLIHTIIVVCFQKTKQNEMMQM